MHRWSWLILLLVVATTASAAPPVTLEAALGVPPSTRKVVLVENASLSPVPGQDLRFARGFRRFDVLAETDDAVRVREIGDHGELAVWVSRRDLLAVPAQVTQIVKGKGGVGAWVPAGASLEDKGGDAVQFDDDNVRIAGQIDKTKLVTVFVPTAEKKVAPDNGLVDKGTDLLLSPGGKPFATILNGPLSVRREKSLRGHVLIVVDNSRGFRLVGWVRKAAFTAQDFGEHGGVIGGVIGGDLGGAAPDPSLPVLPVGSTLHAAPGGPVVGVVQGRVQARPVERKDGWSAWKLRFWTSGEHVLWSKDPAK